MSSTPTTIHSLADVRKEIDAFTREDLYRFNRFARYQLYRFPQLGPEDLVNETAFRFWDGRRSWAQGEDFRTVFYNALRSVADEFRDAELSKPYMVEADLPENTDGTPGSVDDRAIDARTPERALEAQQLIDEAFNAFRDDQDVGAILMGRMEKQSAEEVQATFAMTADEYHAARKRLERWLRRKTD